VFDHRNASLRKWLLDEYIGGKTGMGHPDVSGMFLDDQWDPVLGPSEFVCGGKKPCNPSKLPFCVAVVATLASFIRER
jgi:hypothetical protein